MQGREVYAGPDSLLSQVLAQRVAIERHSIGIEQRVSTDVTPDRPNSSAGVGELQREIGEGIIVALPIARRRSREASIRASCRRPSAAWRSVRLYLKPGSITS